MKLRTCLILIAPMTGASGEEFVPPSAFPVDRYEANWNTNPFTLKTAPVAIQKESFAKDLVLGSMVQQGDVVTVVVVNTITRERIRLNNSEASPEGIKVKTAVIHNTRRDSHAEIEKDGEVAVLRYNDDFQKQMVASGQPETARAGGRVPAELAGKLPAGRPTVPFPNPQGQAPLPGVPSMVPPPPTANPAAVIGSAGQAERSQPALVQRRRLLNLPTPPKS